MKKSADAILNEVRKKINDVTKTMDLLKGIQKLRKLRSDRLKQQGEIYFPLSNMYIICCVNLRIGVYSLMVKILSFMIIILLYTSARSRGLRSI